MRGKNIRWQGKSFPVLGELLIGRRRYLLLDRLSGPDREKYFAFSPHFSAGGDVCLIHALKRNPGACQLLKVLKRIQNRNLATIIDYQPADHCIYVVTRWVPGESLAARLRRARKRPRLWPSPYMAFRLFRGLAHGLHQLNNQENIVHGDLKPDNLILDRANLVIIDFGSSWTVENSVNRLGGDGRTDAFASPEQHAESGLIDFRSDQFSATAVFYLMLAGELPYAGLGGKAGHPQFRNAFESKCERPSDQCRDRASMPVDFWRRVDELVLKGLAFDPNQRFGDSRSWLAVLNEIDARLTLAGCSSEPTGFWPRIVSGWFQWFCNGRSEQ